MNRQYLALSGVAILLIVLNHAIHFGLIVAPIGGGWLIALNLVESLGTFAVPAFLFISGAFVAYSAAQLSPAFVKSSLSRILWPYLIWSVAFFILELLAGVRQSPAGYVKNLLVGYPYHFVPLLVFWYLASPVLVKWGKHRGLMLVLAVGLFQALLIFERYPHALGSDRVLPEWAHIVRVPVLFTSLSDWAIFFPLGLVFSMHDSALKPVMRRFMWPLLALTAALFVLGVLHATRAVQAPWARAVAPVPLVVLLPLISRSSIPLLGFVEILGRRSYGIYLAHFVVINAAVLAASRMSPALASLTPAVAAVFLVGALLTPLLLMDAMTLVAPARRLYRYVFGIVPPPAALVRHG